MSIENEFGFIGWSTKDSSDKIWGYFYRPTPDFVPHWAARHHGRNVCIFWGRRGKAMQFKSAVAGPELDNLTRSKLSAAKGYIRIDQTKLLTIWPTFIQEAEAKLMWAVLAGDIK